MKKKKLIFSELSELFSVLDGKEQQFFIGGGNGTASNPFTEYEANRMIEEGVFNGGYVRDDCGELSYWLPDIDIWPSGYGYSNNYYFTQGGAYYGSEDSWDAYCYDPNYNPWASDENPYGFLDLTGDMETISNAIEEYSGKTQVGTNGQLYYETKTGRVFRGNQYVGTTSLEGLAKSLNKVLGPVSLGISVYNVVDAFNTGGIDAASTKVRSELGGWAGAIAGGKLGSSVGCFAGPPGVLIGGVIGAVIGSHYGSVVVEIKY